MVSARHLIPALFLVTFAGFALARGRKLPDETPTDPSATPVAISPENLAGPMFPKTPPLDIGPIPEGLTSISAQTCGSCHIGAHNSWENSAHSQAWRDPIFQAAVHAAGNSTFCLQCHLPITSQHDQLATQYKDGDLTQPIFEDNKNFNLTLRGEGVTCATCHVRDGAIISTRLVTDAPHPVKVSNELATPEFCATCHQLSWPEGDRPFYDTYGEWKASTWAQAGVVCTDCHMASTPTTALPGESDLLPSHAFAVDQARALTVLVNTPAAHAQRGQPLNITLNITNTGAGHAFPTGNPAKTAIIQVAVIDANGQPLATPFTYSMARTTEATPPYKTTADNRLLPGTSTSAEHSFALSSKGAAGMGAIEVTLIRLLPPDNKTSQVLQRIPFEYR